MRTTTAIAVTTLVLSTLLMLLAWKAKGVGPLILAGAVLGLAVGVSATLLAAGLT
jgi:hypothetical protein